MDGWNAPHKDINLNVAIQRLGWLDEEITRYRDLEWRITSFHSVFLAAVFYLFIDAERRSFVEFMETLILAAVWLYVSVAIVHLIYVHRRLNQRRDERREICELTGQPVRNAQKSTAWNLYEGRGVVFFISLISILVGCVIGDTLVILHCE